MTEQTIIMTKKKDCKHSVVYEAPAEYKDPAITSVYVARTFLGGNPPEKLTITISPVK